MYLNNLAFTLLVICSVVTFGISHAVTSSYEKTEESLSLSDMETKFEALTLQITQLHQMLLEYSGKCDVKSGDSCYFGVFVNPNEVNQNAARLLCEKKGAQPGNIYTSYNYNEVMSYLRPWIGTRLDGVDSIGIITGMRVEPQSQIVYLSDNSRALYVKWSPSYPVASLARTELRLFVHPEGDVKNGMINAEPESGTFGVLCEIKL